MGALLSWIRCEPGVDNYEKFLTRLEAQSTSIEVHHQPVGTYSYRDSIIRVSPVFAIPIISIFTAKFYEQILTLLDSYDKRKIDKIHSKRNAIIKELKDRHNFEKVMQLLKKHDPEEREKLLELERAKNKEVKMLKAKNNKDIISGTVSVSANVVSKAGRAIFPVVDKFANAVMGDDPKLIEEIRNLEKSINHLKNLNQSLTVENENLKESLRNYQEKENTVTLTEKEPTKTDINDDGNNDGSLIEPILNELAPDTNE